MPLASGKARGSLRHAAGARAARFLGVATASQASSGGSRLALAAGWGVGCAATVGERVASATLAGERSWSNLSRHSSSKSASLLPSLVSAATGAFAAGLLARLRAAARWEGLVASESAESVRTVAISVGKGSGDALQWPRRAYSADNATTRRTKTADQYPPASTDAWPAVGHGMLGGRRSELPLLQPRN